MIATLCFSVTLDGSTMINELSKNNNKKTTFHSIILNNLNNHEELAVSYHLTKNRPLYL